jgi:hypothetical protein
MAARVFKLEKLATRIATHLLAISPESTVSLALTCRALEVPALRALWEAQSCSLSRLIMRVLSDEILCFAYPGNGDLCLLVSLPSLVSCVFCIPIDRKNSNRRCSDHLLPGS